MTCHLFSPSTGWTGSRDTDMKINLSATVMAECLVVRAILTETLNVGIHIHNLYQNDNYCNFPSSLVRNQTHNKRPG